MDRPAQNDRIREQADLLAHGNALLRYAITRVGDRPTAEDLVQDTLVTAVGKASEFGGTLDSVTALGHVETTQVEVRGVCLGCASKTRPKPKTTRKQGAKS